GEAIAINGPLSKAEVRVYSNVTSNVTIHCKSKDDDLGEHVITRLNFYGWSFKVNLVETTLYFCDISTQNGRGVYDIYKARRDANRCHICLWQVEVDGVHGYRDGNNVPDIWFKW
ncbi:Self-incomp_S1 domain-containing protein, partial [Cephalotus follicularis]